MPREDSIHGPVVYTKSTSLSMVGWGSRRLERLRTYARWHDAEAAALLFVTVGDEVCFGVVASDPALTLVHVGNAAVRIGDTVGEAELAAEADGTLLLVKAGRDAAVRVGVVAAVAVCVVVCEAAADCERMDVFVASADVVSVGVDDPVADSVLVHDPVTAALPECVDAAVVDGVDAAVIE